MYVRNLLHGSQNMMSNQLYNLDNSFNAFNTKCNTSDTQFIFLFTNVSVGEKGEAFPLKYYTKPLSNARIKNSSCR